MYLVIGEKPSVSQALAKVIGAYQREDGYLSGRDCIVSWCVGHLAEYAPPENYGEQYKKWNFDKLPIVPDRWELLVSKDTRKQFDILKTLLGRDDLDYVVNACDAGREGELIFKRVYDLSGSRIPVKRLWISSMEDFAIEEGFAHLKDGEEYRNLAEAAVCRAKADWLVGMNGTRAFTTTYGKIFRVGRVQTPTLAMLVERQREIDDFRKEAYYKVLLTVDGMTFASEKISMQEEAKRLAEQCQGRNAEVTALKKERKKKSSPKLYDLTSLQREANRQFGYTAKETLDILQELYEEKLVTYPRTDSRYVTDDMEETVCHLAETLMENLLDFTYGISAEKTVNSAKVSDHHAILPTKQAMEMDWTELPEKKRSLLYLTAMQVLKAVAEDYQYEQTDVTVSCAGHEFHASGKRPIQKGYQAAEDVFRKKYFSAKAEEDTEKETVLSELLAEGVVMQNVMSSSKECFTAPPKPYSEDTLLAAMENAGSKDFEKDTEKKGLGTPATRAAIIEKLVSSNYAVRKGKQILPTEDGKELVSILPEHLKSAAMTALWENELLAVERGTASGDVFMKGIVGMLIAVLEECRNVPAEERNRFNEREAIGVCPICQSPVYEGNSNFYCANRECSFALWKENRYLAGMKKKLDNRMAANLLKEGRTFVKNLYSVKKDKYFDAYLLMEAKDGRTEFHLEFPKSTGEGKKRKHYGKK